MMVFYLLFPILFVSGAAGMKPVEVFASEIGCVEAGQAMAVEVAGDPTIRQAGPWGCLMVDFSPSSPAGPPQELPARPRGDRGKA